MAEEQRTCDGPDCVRPIWSRGYCKGHYRQWHLGKELAPLRLQKGGPRKKPAQVCPECGRPATTRGYCPSHYQQWRMGRPFTVPRSYSQTHGPICEVPDCERPNKARGLCAAHWGHMKKYGEVREIRVYHPDGRVCGISGCDELALAKLRCAKHINYAGYNLSRFHITLEDFVRMMDEQGGVCAVCGGTNPNGHALSVDHDHACCPGERSCGKCVRSLLCSNCNFATGLMHDDPARLRAAAAYIESHRFRLVV